MNKAVYKFANKLDNMKRALEKHSYVQLKDDTELTAEPTEALITCSSGEVRIALRQNILVVTGTRLTVRGFGDSGLNVTGKISGIRFEGKTI
ncbi:MAG: hypothetical protein LBN40_06805 [Oscillospiraceae bacterium]|nr:hypothetical protein [Oscillospiraceae bacterium]